MSEDISKFLQVKYNEIEMMINRGFILNHNQNAIYNGNYDYTNKTLKIIRKELNSLFNKVGKEKVINIESVNIYSRILNGVKMYTVIGHSDMVVTNNEKLTTFQNFIVNFKDSYPLERCIYVSHISIGSGAKTIAEELKTNYNCQFFTEKQLSYNVIKNIMVPEHQILSELDKNILLRDLRISINHMPQILIEDPVIKWYGWPVGNIVKITRQDPPEGKYYDYRLIVNRNWVD